MSVFYGVRLPDDLSQMVEATGRGKSEVITAAVSAYFGTITPLNKADVPNDKATVVMVKPRTIKATKQPSGTRGVAAPASGVQPLASVIKPAIISGCPKHPGGVGWAKAGGWWCVQCGRIV